VFELGDIFRAQTDVLVLALTYDSFLDVSWLGSFLGLDLVLRRARKAFPGALLELLRLRGDDRYRRTTEDEAQSVIIPAIQMLGLRERCIAADGDLSKPGSIAEIYGTVDPVRRALLRWSVSAAIDEVQRLSRLRQRDEQRVVSPRALVRHIHPFLALAGRLGDDAVDVDCRLGEEVGVLLPPHSKSGLVEDAE